MITCIYIILIVRFETDNNIYLASFILKKTFVTFIVQWIGFDRG